MADRSGQQLGNYRIVRLLGKGGFAEVYLGEHIYLNTPVAIKVLHAQVTDSNMDDFLKEARTIARLRHPHIVRVLEFGIEDKTPFLAMEYAPNGTLRQRHRKGSQLPLATIVPYVNQIASALQHAHDEKLIHRDIKPENMLLGERDEILLSDFGIAMVAESSRLQSTKEIVGTVAYMAPEQIQGKPRPASDQYSLAVVVYEWLSGDRPFQGSFTELCTQHIYASPPPLRERIPAIAAEVEQVVSRALAKDPHQRFSSIQSFANALEEAFQLQQETVSSASGKYTVVEPEPVMRTEPAMRSGPPPTPRNPEQEHAPVLAEQEKEKIWSIGKRRIVAMAAGAAFFAVLFFLSNRFELIDFANTTFVALTLLALLFFGTVFGPWVGLITGGGGFLLGWAFIGISQGQYIFDIVFWRLELGFTIAGFIAGLAMLVTKGRYNNFPAIATAVGISIIASCMGIYIASLPNITLSDLISHSIIPGLILLPISLAIYNAITSYRIGELA